ncbi:MAG: hypothetical protein JNM69_24850 [Archangium sp.]|nr:hypothetical protein [Archangium sp.]
MSKSGLSIAVVCLMVVACKKNSPEQLAALQSAADAYCTCARSALADTPRERAAMVAARARCEALSPALDAARAQLAVPVGQDPAARAITDLQKACYTSLTNSIPMGK